MLGMIILGMVYLFSAYNRFINLNNLVQEAFSTMDVYLKKRWDLVPNLVESVRGYAKHENETLEEITKLRGSLYDNMSSKDKIDTNEKLTAGLSRLMIVSENYPELKASENFITLSKQLIKIEEDIANSRKYYNAIVRKFNIKIQMFPSNIIANLFNFKLAQMFQISNDERSNVKVELEQ